MKSINPLIAIPSPRDIPEFIKAMDSITDIDKLWIKYSPSYITYPLIRKEFLENKNKYTHLIICPDDLIIERDKLQILIDDFKNLLSPKEQNRTVISGYCNVDTSEEHSHEANICSEYVTPRRQGRRYKYIKLSAIQSMLGHIERKRKDQRAQEIRLQTGQDKIYHRDETHPNEFNQQFLLDVKFAGFGMIMIPRSILEKFELMNDQRGYPVKKNQGCCEDVMFCHNCLERNFKIYVDIRAGFKHLKSNDIATFELIKMTWDKEVEPFLKYEFTNDKILTKSIIVDEQNIEKEVELKIPTTTQIKK